MDSLSNILKTFNPVEDKYISRDFQAFGIELSEEFGDYKRRGLYIKLAKTIPRPILEKARSFVVDSNAKNKGALFMWKLKELGAFERSDPNHSIPLMTSNQNVTHTNDPNK